MKLFTFIVLTLSATLTTAHTVTCGANRGGGDARRIREGIRYLHSIGEYGTTLGPGECERPSCSWGSGIWWCNDDKENSRTMLFRHIADGAQTIYDDCPHVFGRKGGVGGEVDHPDKWRVIVGYAENDC